MGHADRKLERLKVIERLLMDRRWTVVELAERMDVSRQTVYNYLLELPAEQDDEGRWWIDRRTYISEIALSHDEALVLYLALRRTQRQTLLRREAVADALSKVSRTLGKPMVDRMVTAANRIMEQEEAPAEREALLSEIVKAWANRLVLNLTYQGLRGGRQYEDRFRCYLIEPSPWGDGTYLIGHSDTLGKVVTYKVERIQRASCSGEQFDIPTEMLENDLLESAWGIWTGEGEATTVLLKFRDGAPARRVRESVWHRSAERTDLPDGSALLRLTLGEVSELLPWIRSWGSDVEVLEPIQLRIEMIREIRRYQHIYSLEYSSISEKDDAFDDERASQLFRKR